MKLGIAFLLSSLLLLLGACASKQPAPVAEPQAPLRVLEQPAASPLPAAPAAAPLEPRPYTVKKGDTLYSIALDHGQSYRDLAAWNSLEDPNKIQIGQQLRVQPPEALSPVAVAKPVASPNAVEVRPASAMPSPEAGGGTNSDSLKREPRAVKRPYSEEALAALRRADLAYAPGAAPVAVVPPAKEETKVDAKPASEEDVDWGWPAPGKLIAGFVEGSNKGIDIAAKAGEPVLAAASGKVVYSGSSLRGYGKLVIVKHSPSFLSAYAHNSQLLVKEGQSVQKGQKIAEAGSSDAEQPMLHFEIRRQGKPVDPLRHLPGR